MKLTKIEQVEKRVGKPAGPRDLKVIDHVDEHASRWLSHARFGCIAFGKAGKIQLTLAGGESGFVSCSGAGTLVLPVAALDDPSLCHPGISFGALFMVGGMEETLRVNGTVDSVGGDVARLTVQECYLHCAKSFRRSDFWAPQSVEESGCEPAEFIKRSRFLVLATINGSGQADVSPKGDPEDFLIQLDDELVCFADRPGNRRIDSFRNIMEQPLVSIVAMVPGCSDVLQISGEAAICDDEELARHFEVQGKTPKLVTRVTPLAMTKRTSQAISRAALWPAGETPDNLVASEIFKAHVKRSKQTSLQAKVARAAMSVPGAMEKGLEMDYKKNMY